MILSATASSAQERRIGFDIASQPLARALVEFADKTGMATLIDGELTKGVSSSLVKGRFFPSEALEVLLSGTGFSIRNAGTRAFTIGLEAPEQSGSARPRSERRADHGLYFSQVQNSVEGALCRNETIRPGRYHMAFQLWLAENGSVEAIHFLDTSGDDARDATISAVLTKLSLTPPPRDMPQPLTILLRPKPRRPDCFADGVPAP